MNGFRKTSGSTRHRNLISDETLAETKPRESNKGYANCYDMHNLIDSLPYLVIGLIKNMQ